jgi:hypothetical protein
LTAVLYRGEGLPGSVLVRLQGFRLEALPMLEDPNVLNILESGKDVVVLGPRARPGRGTLITSRDLWAIPDGIVDLSMLYRRFEC